MVLLSRLLGFLRDAIIAGYFGQNAITSAYLYAFTLPDTLWNLIAGGAFFAAFVPVITHYITQGREQTAWRVYSIVTTFLFCVLSVVIPLAWIFARPLFEHFLAPGFGNLYDADGRLLRRDYAEVPGFGVVHPLTMAVDMTRIVLPAQYCFFLGTLMMGMLQARKQFLMPALGPVFYNLGIILSGVFLSRYLGIAAFSWGALGGAIFGNLLLQIWAIRRIGGRFRPSLRLRHPGVRQCGRLVLPVIFGVSLPQVSAIVNGIVVAGVPQAKTILEFSNRLMQLPLGIFGQAIGIAVLPTLTQQATTGDMQAFRRTLNYGLRLALFLTIPASALICALARPLITLVYEHGAFTRTDTLETVMPLVLFSVGVGAWSAQSVLARAFYATGSTWTPVIAGSAATLLVYAPANLVLSHVFNVPGTSLLARGPALATSLAAVVNTAALVWMANRQFGGINLPRLTRSVMRTTLASIVLALVAYLVHGALAGRLSVLSSPKLTALAELSVASVAGLIPFLVLCILLGSRELLDILRLVRRRRAEPPTAAGTPAPDERD